jgi:sodium/proline symporter
MESPSLLALFLLFGLPICFSVAALVWYFTQDWEGGMAVRVEVTIFLLYLVGVAALGYYGYRKTVSLKDFVIGSKKLGAWTVSISSNASAVSAWVFLEAPGIAYRYGLASAWMIVTGVGFYVIQWLIVYRRLYRYSQHTESLTYPEFFSDRFRDTRPLIQGISAIPMLFFVTAYIAAPMAGAGIFMAQVFEMPYIAGVLVGFGIIVLYTLAGGFLAVSLTDVLQGTIMVFVIIGIPLAAVSALGGFGPYNSRVGTNISCLGYDFLSATVGATPGKFIQVMLLSTF